MRQVPECVGSKGSQSTASTPATTHRRGGVRSVNDFQRARNEGMRLSMATCYDAWSARLLAETTLDALLVGDSVSMVVHGHPSTVHADLDMMALHTAAVRRGYGEGFVVSDIPFPMHRQGTEVAMRAVDELAKAGANAVKVEGARGHLETVHHIVEGGMPVMGHLGLTPQSVHQLGGYRVQGRSDAAAEAMVEDARALEAAGAFAIVLECVPVALAKRITESLSIPTVGIGSGADCSGQVLVLHDMLGLNPGFKPRFLRMYMEGASAVQAALDQYAADVRNGSYPTEAESFK